MAAPCSKFSWLNLFGDGADLDQHFPGGMALLQVLMGFCHFIQAKGAILGALKDSRRRKRNENRERQALRHTRAINAHQSLSP